MFLSRSTPPVFVRLGGCQRGSAPDNCYRGPMANSALIFSSFGDSQSGRRLGIQIPPRGYETWKTQGQQVEVGNPEGKWYVRARGGISPLDCPSCSVHWNAALTDWYYTEAREAESGNSSPILPEMDEKIMAVFPTGKPRETELEKVNCKHCKRPILKQAAAEHIPACLKAKQEKARKKKEARDAANRAKAGVDKDGNGDGEGKTAVKGQKSAKKSAGDDGPKKGKKRKADGDEEKETKKKKKKDEPKKTSKPKGPVDVEKQCGVVLPNGAQCARSLTCKTHSMGAKRAVPGRSLPYDMLLQAYQKKNQAKQQSEFPTFRSFWTI